MPRQNLGPKVWFDKRRGTWTILDGRKRVRTGTSCAGEAEDALTRYIYDKRVYADNHRPSRRKQPPLPAPPSGEDFISLREATAIFEGDVSVETLRLEIASGRIPGYRIGRQVFTSRAAVTKLSDGIMRLKRTDLGKGVYVIGYGEYIKIGVTRDIKGRINTLQTSAPGKLEIYAMFEGWLRDEALLHKRFSKHRTNGEWFRREGELAQWIDGGCK